MPNKTKSKKRSPRWGLSYEEKKEASDKMDLIRSYVRPFSNIREGVLHEDIDLDENWEKLSVVVDQLYDILKLAQLKAENSKRHEQVMKRVKENERKGNI